jgi:acyl-CoA dehydrogenase
MFNMTGQRRQIQAGVTAVCKRFDDNYWASCEKEARFLSFIVPWLPTDGSA